MSHTPTPQTIVDATPHEPTQAIPVAPVGVTPQQLKAAASVMAHFHARPRMSGVAAPGNDSRPSAA